MLRHVQQSRLDELSLRCWSGAAVAEPGRARPPGAGGRGGQGSDDLITQRAPVRQEIGISCSRPGWTLEVEEGDGHKQATQLEGWCSGGRRSERRIPHAAREGTMQESTTAMTEGRLRRQPMLIGGDWVWADS